MLASGRFAFVSAFEIGDASLQFSIAEFEGSDVASLARERPGTPDR